MMAALIGCAADEFIYPYDPFQIKSVQEQHKLERNALNGDIAAATRLAQYYEVVIRDVKKARFWYHVAASHGDPVAKDTLRKLDSR
jgi:TPR repeat protein